jgi:hypothetical protein
VLEHTNAFTEDERENAQLIITRGKEVELRHRSPPVLHA